MRLVQRAAHFLFRALLFLVPVVAIGVATIASYSYVSAQLADVPQTPRADLLLPGAEQPFDLSPATLQTRLTGLYLQWQAKALNTPAGSDSTLQAFRVNTGESALAVSQQLLDQGLIQDANLFRLYMRYQGIDQQLAAGDFQLAPNMTIPEIAQHLQHSRVEEVVLTVPEGMRAEEIADLLNVKGVMDGEAFLALVRGGNASASALGDYSWLPGGLSSLEGYLFPDTYRLPAQATPADLIQRMLDDFGQRVTPDIVAEATRSGRSLNQVITIASIVEREAQQADERPIIASVYWNRVSGACSSETGGAYLQADPTVQYAAGHPGEWWWKPPSVEAYQGVLSPYNTYLHPGLPPGPISNPGLSAIRAAAGASRHTILFLCGHRRWAACVRYYLGRTPSQCSPLSKMKLSKAVVIGLGFFLLTSCTMPGDAAPS